MKTLLKSKSYCLFEEVLPPDQRRAVLSYAQGAPIQSVHTGTYERVWSLDDGNPLTGPTTMAAADAKARRQTKQSPHHFPTGNAVDHVFDRLLRSSKALEPWIGKRGVDWTTIIARLAIYPRGAGLAWHDDAKVYSGAFTLFIHPHWEIDWGGELMFLEGPVVGGAQSKEEGRAADPLRGRILKRQEYTRSSGSFVLPWPNTLVVLRNGVTHSVSPVRDAAGNVPRMAISGFFVRD